MSSALSVLSVDIKESARAEEFLSTYVKSIPEEGTYYMYMCVYIYTHVYQHIQIMYQK
jgi:hypothetical protein